MDFHAISTRGKTLMKAKELECLYYISTKIRARNILEIGSCYGCSSMVLATVAKEQGGHLQCLDHAPQKLWRTNMQEMGLYHHCTMIAGYSPWVDDKLINTPIDLLFIDGEHRSRWCLADYHYWSPYVRLGGRIVFHDYKPGNAAGNGVIRAVDIILEDDDECLVEIAHISLPMSGMIVFEKIAFSPHTPKLGF